MTPNGIWRNRLSSIIRIILLPNFDVITWQHCAYCSWPLTVRDLQLNKPMASQKERWLRMFTNIMGSAKLSNLHPKCLDLNFACLIIINSHFDWQNIPKCRDMQDRIIGTCSNSRFSSNISVIINTRWPKNPLYIYIYIYNFPTLPVCFNCFHCGSKLF